MEEILTLLSYNKAENEEWMKNNLKICHQTSNYCQWLVDTLGWTIWKSQQQENLSFQHFRDWQGLQLFSSDLI